MKMHNFTLYKIFYQKQCVYLGRTKQPISARLRGHFFKKHMHKMIDIELVSRIEICSCKTEADMFLYEIYYISKLQPPLNTDDKPRDKLTIELPELEFTEYKPKRMETWKKLLIEKELEHKIESQRILEEMQRDRDLKNDMRKTLNHEEYLKWLDERE